MGLEITQRGDTQSIRMTGSASVRVVAEVRDALLTALRERSAVSLDMRDVSSADAAFVQLIASARLSFAEHSQPFEIEDPAGVIRSAFLGN